ncbi:MAG: hypothetical protein ACR2HS_05670, partial [Gammaproteobacteria bacterium]
SVGRLFPAGTGFEYHRRLKAKQIQRSLEKTTGRSNNLFSSSINHKKPVTKADLEQALGEAFNKNDMEG